MQQAVFGRADNLRRGEFRGSAGEYFGIWIVNILLTIVTVGIYSAWAKVRRNRYFYGNSFVDGHSFDYHARGLQIFIGRAIVFGYIIAYNVLLTFSPIIGGILALLMFFLLPWIVMRSLRFNARVTSYRNIRFDFVGKTWGAVVAIIFGGIVAFFSLGILAPFASRWLYRYIFNNLRYGDRAFETDPKIGALYRVWLPAFLLMLVGAAVGGAIAMIAYYSAVGVSDETMIDLELQVVFAVYAALIPALLLWGIAAIFYRIGVRNVVMNATRFDTRHSLFSDLGRLRYFWIVISNLVVTIVTLSLMRPWAAVREHRYVMEHSGIVVDGELGDVVASMQNSGSAVTAEYLDLEGFDFGF
ncbi:MAG: YjgN family protein [Rhizobium rhizophilum]|uniref:YjgN family protein n=1 Tax=Rhizobium rhizophilum TaxID=1850373 RepID=UPI00391955B9